MYLRCLWLQYFLRSQFRAYLWSSTPNVLIFCDFISLSAFFMFGLWQFCYHVYRHGFLWVYSALCSVKFLNLQVNVSHQFGEVFSHCFLKYIFLNQFLCRTLLLQMLDLWYNPLTLNIQFFLISSFFRLDNFC